MHDALRCGQEREVPERPEQHDQDAGEGPVVEFGDIEEQPKHAGDNDGDKRDNKIAKVPANPSIESAPAESGAAHRYP
ncbi:MAG: hypothetical protein A4E65_00274 [Syntrophorhabdus sp. PtaU1.Bin153]|nr:MAG: hypothetical protein A4E65_00274 [Syntrophorhabdus sp. PtaU1.Bin153]